MAIYSRTKNKLKRKSSGKGKSYTKRKGSFKNISKGKKKRH